MIYYYQNCENCKYANWHICGNSNSPKYGEIIAYTENNCEYCKEKNINMKVTTEEAKDIIDIIRGVSTSDWATASEQEIDSIDRYTTSKNRVFKHLPSGKFFRIYWSQNTTINIIKIYELQEVLVKKWVCKEEVK